MKLLILWLTYYIVNSKLQTLNDDATRSNVCYVLFFMNASFTALQTILI